MKTYSYSIEMDYTNNGQDFIGNLIGEVKDEKKQLDLTHKINLATKEMHRKLLLDLAEELNVHLKKVGLRFDLTENVSSYGKQDTNKYKPHYIICKYPKSHLSHVIMITAESDRGFKDSKYMTFTGDYYLKIGTTDQGQVWSGTKNGLHTCEKNVDKILLEMRHSLKTHVRRMVCEVEL